MVVANELSTNESQRHPEIKLLTRSPEGKGSRKNPNNYVRSVVNGHGLPNQTEVTSKAGVPEPLAQHYDFFGSGLFFLWCERGADSRFPLEEVKEICQNARPPPLFGLTLSS